MPEVSVVIPTKNRSQTIRKAVESVLQQTYGNLEVFIVDGGTDDTRSVIKQISDSDDRVKYYFREDGGVSGARNLGAVKGQGKFVAFLDSDDLWPENYLEIMLNHLRAQKEYSGAYGRVMVLSDDGQTTPLVRDHRYKTGWLTKDFYHGSPCVLPSATVFKRDVFKKVLFDEQMSRGEDYDFFLRLSVVTPFLFVSDAHILRYESSDGTGKNVNVDELCYGPFSFERFHYELDGKKIIPAIFARYAFSHKYRKVAKLSYKRGNRAAAILFIKRALRYYPFDLRLYPDMLKALLLNPQKDPYPDWKIPEPFSKPFPEPSSDFESVWE